MRTLYIKMKTENGSSVYRNIAPQSATNKLSFATGPDTLVATYAEQVAMAFVPIQTEKPDLKDGLYQFKVVDEWTFNYADGDPVTLSGGDAWTDTTEEKLLANFTDGDKTYTVRLAKAASAIDPDLPNKTYITAVRDYANKLQEYYRTADVDATVDGYSADWTEVHLTGTRDSLVARPD